MAAKTSDSVVEKIYCCSQKLVTLCSPSCSSLIGAAHRQVLSSHRRCETGKGSWKEREARV